MGWRTETGTTWDVALSCQFTARHNRQGGYYVMGGTIDAWLSITCNYDPIFQRVFGDVGIRRLYGLTAKESLAVLDSAVATLPAVPREDDYWRPSEGNARAALLDLRALAEQAVKEHKGDAVWFGDVAPQVATFKPLRATSVHV